MTAHTRTGRAGVCRSTTPRRNNVASTSVVSPAAIAASRTHPTPHADPYVAGVALGLVLLSAFVLTGRGLGASGAFATTAAGTVAAVAPARAAATPYFSRYV